MDEKKMKERADGIYFLPGDEDDELLISHWEFKPDSEYHGGTPLDGSEIGNCYHIAFFRKDEEGNPVFDEHFEAIFGDPDAYIRSLTGCGLYGCMVKKTDKSPKWFEEYLYRTVGRDMIDKMTSALNSLVESK